MLRLLAYLPLAAVLLLIAGGSEPAEPAPQPTATAAPPPTKAASPAPEPTPTPQVVRQDIRATRLSIPAVGIDAEVQLSQTIPYVYVPPPGCPPRDTEETETVTVPNQGIATPEDNLEGLENKAWIYGHSRWLGAPGVFFALRDLEIGDELVLDGVDRETGEALSGRRYVVDGLYLVDTDSGEELLNAYEAEDIPPQPVVILQTSVREDGAGKQWIFDRQALLAKTTNTVAGDPDDPCKYLLLLVTASPAS